MYIATIYNPIIPNCKAIILDTWQNFSESKSTQPTFPVGLNVEISTIVPIICIIGTFQHITTSYSFYHLLGDITQNPDIANFQNYMGLSNYTIPFHPTIPTQIKNTHRGCLNKSIILWQVRLIPLIHSNFNLLKFSNKSLQ